MDFITHGAVGLAIGSVNNSEFFNNPLALGSFIGSVIPDGDIIFQYWGDYTYLKNHRGASHSIVGALIISLITSGILRYFYPDYGFFSIMLWTLLGFVCHLSLDVFNSYGTEILWPLNNKKYASALFMSFDPLLFILVSSVFINNRMRIIDFRLSIILVLLYLIIRVIMRSWAISIIRKKFIGCNLERVVILPSAFRLFNWEFIIYIERRIITGRINVLTRKLSFRNYLEKAEGWIDEGVMKSPLGKFFSEFSKYYYINCVQKGEMFYIIMTDLRYYIRGNYLHHATGIYNSEMELLDCTFHPYYIERNVSIPISQFNSKVKRRSLHGLYKGLHYRSENITV